MQILRADVADEFLDIGDVVVQMKLAGFERHHACVDPVGQVDLVVLQQRPHGVAQQRGVVSRQRCADQHDRFIFQLGNGVAVVGETLETHQTAKRFLNNDLFDDRNVMTIFNNLVEIELGLFVILAKPVEQLVTG
ncbi:hypothetical protein LMG28614_07320 [Paraburkholderia ultramafica]|uniref:Uncharacterized protein n=1 Tax=Paraburkholderia ultramafica TaxID=1544867 RepID=A0A6S7BR23_9BURK|nr:hypothetical protein LMG28614_07320 [Paraburkholderia ultramafica]